ncbi:hypothetical protein CDL12_19091 [Handroanthus impetiginosus]|uniref:SWIM-type domain-containing protein n=1 Tax=Handroanthus impetiginosus TaxID=429701 RepID=A0A2G9GSV4_9LAMI|nr:hypothetical protein CDL12_19091 [Handroanthus impetiginosus]
MEENLSIPPQANEANNFCEFTEQSIFTESYLPKPREVQSISSIIDELDSRLVVGQVVKSVEDAYFLYCDYAHAKGFSIRKGDQPYFPCSNELQAKEFECSCGGPTIKTKCKARPRIGQEKEEEWKVTRFVMEHNHEIGEVDQTYLLRSSRNLSNAQKSTLEAMVNAGIYVASAVSYMEEKAHGPENLRFTRKDAYDYIRSLKKHRKSNNEPYFYWDAQLDDDNRVMNFFFRDYRCRIDYESFGDVLSVDTTYRTNRYNLIMCSFCGLWQWHINQSAPSHLEKLNCDSRLKQLWNKCRTYCDSKEEFEETDHKWLNGMYKLRHNWATTFSNTRFSARLLATSRSEGTNSMLKKANNRTISLYDFFVEDPSFVGPFFILFKVKSLNQYSRIRNVWLNKQKNVVKCSCYKFDSMGILCKHALKVLNHVKVHSLPKQYIKKRWMKSMRNRDARSMLTKILHNTQEKTIVLLENLSLNYLHACDDVVVD